LVDVKGAFDNVRHKDLLEELYFLGLPPTLIKWLEAYLADRHLSYHSTQKGTIKRPLHKGVPQGGVLSPILYILYVRALEHHIDTLFKLLSNTLTMHFFTLDITTCK
jgi:retron-type reverse transcriptase